MSRETYPVFSGNETVSGWEGLRPAGVVLPVTHGGAGENRTPVREAVDDRATTIPMVEPLRLAHCWVRWPKPPARLCELSAVFLAVSVLSHRQPPLLLPGCGGLAPCAIAGHDVSLGLI